MGKAKRERRERVKAGLEPAIRHGTKKQGRQAAEQAMAAIFFRRMMGLPVRRKSNEDSADAGLGDA